MSEGLDPAKLDRLTKSIERERELEREGRYSSTLARSRADAFSSDGLGTALTLLGIIVVSLAVAGGGLIVLGAFADEKPELAFSAIGFALLGSVQGALVWAVGRMLEMLRSVSIANAATVILLEGIAADTSRSAQYMHEAVRYQQGD